MLSSEQSLVREWAKQKNEEGSMDSSVRTRQYYFPFVLVV
jgi:hypothetical protein